MEQHRPRDEMIRAMGWQFAEIWQAPPRELRLQENEVHLWMAAVPDCLPQLSEYERMLAEDERERAARFHFEHDRQRWIVSRAILRRLLGRYLGQPDVRFICNRYGKPSLENPRFPLRFNVAHSRDLALFGFIRERDIGVDVEWMRPNFATTDVAERFFAPDEATLLASLPQPARLQAFFNCWTRKEAYIKARGLGLSMALHGFSVTLVSGEPAALIRSDDDPTAPQRWTIRDLKVSEGYAAAVAFDGRNYVLKFWRWGTNPS